MFEFTNTKILRQLWVADFADGVNMMAIIAEDTETGKLKAVYRFRYPDGKKSSYDIKPDKSSDEYSIKPEDLERTIRAFEVLFKELGKRAPSPLLSGPHTLVFKTREPTEQLKELNDSGLVDIGVGTTSQDVDKFMAESRAGKHINPHNEDLGNLKF